MAGVEEAAVGVGTAVLAESGCDFVLDLCRECFLLRLPRVCFGAGPTGDLILSVPFPPRFLVFGTSLSPSYFNVS